VSGVGRVTDGRPEPLGASLTPGGLNLAVHAPDASCVEVCLFDSKSDAEVARIPLPASTGPVLHGCLEGVGEGARYGLRAHGPFAPSQGHRFNPSKLLLDPYALQIDRPFTLHASMHLDPRQDPDGLSFDLTDSGPFMPKAIVVSPPAATPPPRGPITPWAQTVIYELHVKGFTRTHPDIPVPLRGTFAGLGHPAAIGHLMRLGVTTVELLPCAAWIDEPHLQTLGLSNYWGYNPVAFCAPDPRLAPGGWAEVRAAVDAMADAGIETMLDVVLNHTGEGPAWGPTLSLRGLDNAGCYRLHPDNPARYIDDAGTGNILAFDRPQVVRLAMDSLRAWRRLGGVSGFRFDLATVLARRADGFDPAAPLLAAIEQDPELRTLKLVAEPWDLGPGGYQLGRFPAGWGEWNDKYRDGVRSFWKGEATTLGELARRMSGSQDVFPGRAPSRSVNFVVAHDGFTLADLVAHETKHNQANGEDNRDGADVNRSWNNGVEGGTSDPEVLNARRKDQRTLLATLMLSRGTPMLAMGSELGHSQNGNNNAYSQDNALSWLDWAKADGDLTAFAARLAQARRGHPAFRADRFLQGAARPTFVDPDVAWRKPDGSGLQAADWDDPQGQTLVAVLAEPDGESVDRVVIIVHRGRETERVTPPGPRDGFAWSVLVDSADEARSGPVSDDDVEVAPRSVLALSEVPAPGRPPRAVDPETLARLCRAAGVATEWWSVDGERHLVSQDSLRALLGSMELPTSSDMVAQVSLVRLAEAFDRRPLPMSMVRRVGERLTIMLGVEAGGPAPRTWLWIEDEHGRSSRIMASPETGEEARFTCRDGLTGRGLRLALPALEVGRYRIWREDRPDFICRLTISPARCHLPQAYTDGRRGFGLSVQLYALRRSHDQGVGDLTTLGELGERAARAGASVLAVNPLHALFPDRRDFASPYYPSDRRFIDPIYLDIGAGAPDLAALSEIDYAKVWALKSAALEGRFAQFRGDPQFDAFVEAGGEPVRQFALFQAICETRPGEPWRLWPQDLQAPDSPAARAFAAARPERVRFHQHLQWLCEEQLTQAAQRASGLELGLCRDLAVGAAPQGAEAWANARVLAQGVHIGAPPDPIAPQGQVWGLPPFDPHRLAAEGYTQMAELFAANMRHAGALRIDHVMGLSRQFWVPEGADGSEGAYVDYPLEDLLGELALESERARCLVIGEDLGTVPEGLRERLAEANVLSYRVLPFERDGDRFRPPTDYPPLAWACVSTHDLPPLSGWWQGLDIAERRELDLISHAEAETARSVRLADKRALLQALAEAGLVEADIEPAPTLTPELAGAIHAFIAMAPSMLAIAQVEDLAGEQVAVNLPGTDKERPNWRRRIGPMVEELFSRPTARAILSALGEGRGFRPDAQA
jgi:glycogen operon protein